MLHCVILAAGKGTRMKSPVPKVLHPVLGRPMILRVAATARASGCRQVTAVIGFGRDQVAPVLRNEGVQWVVQEPQLGTAHALQCAREAWDGAGEVLVLLGDVPLLRAETVTGLLESRRKTDAAMSVLTAEPPDPSGYGRVLRSADGAVARIVEHRDASDLERKCREINTGIMVFRGEGLPALLGSIGNGNAQGEFYLTDAVEKALSLGLGVEALKAGEWLEVRGVNDPLHLAECTRALKRRVVEELLLSGVVIPDPDGVWIEDGAVVEPGACIGRHCRISGRSHITSSARLSDFCVVENARVDCELPEGSVRSGP
jgi:bifunctional UDP-N-acetylglucosamine pyrophosphorylase/glucosamine-1-phosphate N-acetyltransferase